MAKDMYESRTWGNSAGASARPLPLVEEVTVTNRVIEDFVKLLSSEDFGEVSVDDHPELAAVVDRLKDLTVGLQMKEAASLDRLDLIRRKDEEFIRTTRDMTKDQDIAIARAESRSVREVVAMVFGNFATHRRVHTERNYRGELVDVSRDEWSGLEPASDALFSFASVSAAARRLGFALIEMPAEVVVERDEGNSL